MSRSHTNQICSSDDLLKQGESLWKELLEADPTKHEAATTVHNTSSRGRSRRVYGAKSGEIHFLLSDLEYKAFLVFDRLPVVIDIREQFAHPLEFTQALAHERGINHPPKNQVHKVPLTTDFILSLDNADIPYLGVYVKYEKDLENARTIEKLELERASLAAVDVPLVIVTENQIDESLTKAVEWYTTGNDYDFGDSNCNELAADVHQYLMQFPDEKLTEVLFQRDQAEGEPAGQSLCMVKALIDLGMLSFDWRRPIHTLKSGDITLVVQ